MLAETQAKSIDLYIPELKEEDIITYYAQLRPFRQGGPRIELENLFGKKIIHNYGHGGAGVSLAPATSHQAVELAKKFVKPAVQVGIIGSGVVGLLTAYFLRQNFGQLSISIYAQQIPKFGNKNNSDLITSEVAPGYWLPYDYGLKDKDYHQKLSNFAFKWYSEMSLNQKFKDCVKEVEVYSLSDTGVYDQVRKLTENLKHTCRIVDVAINGKIKTKAHIVKSLKIDMQAFLKIIIQQLRSTKVRFVHQKVTKQTLAQISQGVLFNCSGLGSRQLFGDTKMKGLKGHLIEYRNKDPIKYDYFLKTGLGDNKMAYYMHSSRILIGLVVENQQTRTVNYNVVSNIKQIHSKVLQWYGLRQSLPKL